MSILRLVANRVAALRRAAGLSQIGLADRLQPNPSTGKPVDPLTISRWERGVVSMPDKRKLEIAEMFGVPVSHLLGWDDPSDADAA